MWEEGRKKIEKINSKVKINMVKRDYLVAH